MTEHVWGIDPAVAKLSVAFAPVDGTTPQVLTHLMPTEEREGARLGLIDRQARLAAARWQADWPPAIVLIEQPSGRFRNLQLAYAVGVLQAALFETVACPVWTIPSAAWKRATVGRGNADKQAVRDWVHAPHRFPQAVFAESQDESDAVAIACAGRAMLREGWEAAA